MTQVMIELQYNDTAVRIFANAESQPSYDRLKKVWDKVEEVLGPADTLIIHTGGRVWKATRREAKQLNVEYSGTA